MQEKEGVLCILLLADGTERAQKLRAQADQWLEERNLEARYRSLTESNVPKLVYMVQMEESGTLVLPARSALLRDEALLELLDALEVPVLLVR